MVQNIFLGPAGSPEKSTISGIETIRKLGLQAMEVEFTYGVRMSNALAKKIGKINKKEKIKLSVHAPYWINLASTDKKKIEASKKRILTSCERAHYMGASPVVFHPAFYGKLEKEKIYDMVKTAVIEMNDIIKKNKWSVKLAPETTGKHSQFGTLDELIKLSKEVKCFICVDFAHIYARNGGKINYSDILKKMKSLRHIKHYHSHFSGIEFTAKGEKRHTIMSKPAFRPLAKEILKKKMSVTIISESPVTWKDSQKQKKIFEGFGYKFS